MKRVHFPPPSPEDKGAFPMCIEAFGNGADIEMTKPVTIFVGENGSGKSTLLEAIASKCGFSAQGGSRNHVGADERAPALGDRMIAEWLPKVGGGFFLRAESFFNFSSLIDEIASRDERILDYYGGKSLHAQSHGESFLSLFNHHFGRAGVYLLDEPEAALSPQRQLSLLRIIHDMEKEGGAQFIIATHSPILLSYPSAELYHFSADGIGKISYEETDHYKITRSFLENPGRYYRNLFSD